MSNFVISIKALRITNNISQSDMAKELGVHVQTYRKWEKNPNVMEIGNAKKIAKILNIDYNYIFFGSDSTLSRDNKSKRKDV